MVWKLIKEAPQGEYVAHPALLDGALHAACAALLDGEDLAALPKVFASAGRIRLAPHAPAAGRRTAAAAAAAAAAVGGSPPPPPLRLRAKLRPLAAEAVALQLVVTTELGAVVWELEDVVLRRAPSPAELRRPPALHPVDEPRHLQLDWVPAPTVTKEETSADGARPWLVLVEGDPALLRDLSDRVASGHTCADSLPDDLAGFAKVVFVAAPRAPVLA